MAESRLGVESICYDIHKIKFLCFPTDFTLNTRSMPSEILFSGHILTGNEYSPLCGKFYKRMSESLP